MSINDETLIAVADRLTELEAANPILYAALRRMAYLASADRLKTDDVDEVLAAIRQCAKEATDAIDAVTLAEQQRGLEIADEEALEQMQTFGYTMLGDKGKLKVLAALKRQARDEAKSLRSHGNALLALNAKETPIRELALVKSE